MKKAWSQRFLEAAGIPDETLPRQMLLEICGDKRVLIENHLGVVGYGTDCIRVRVPFGNVCIRGENLHLCRMLGRQLIVTGCISGVELEREGNHGNSTR